MSVDQGIMKGLAALVCGVALVLLGFVISGLLSRSADEQIVAVEAPQVIPTTAPLAVPSPTATSTPLPVVMIPTATALPTATVAPAPTVAPTSTPQPDPTPTLVPAPSPTVAPALPLTPAPTVDQTEPTATPLGGVTAATLEETSRDLTGVEAIVTATPTVSAAVEPTATQTPDVTATPTPTAEPTATASATATVEPGGEPVVIAAGWRWVGSSEGLYLRLAPAGAIGQVLVYAEQVHVTGRGAEAEGLTWVEIDSPARGWVALEFLTDVEPAPAPTSGPVTTGEPPTEADWNALRECESSNNYAIVSADGLYHGAYQFLPSTWDGLARRFWPELVGVLPSQAAPADQDKMARKLYELEGARPWPVCGQHLL